MQKSLVVIVIVAMLFAVQVTCQGGMFAPPNRPAEFKSPEELRQYMKALNEYYAIVGRPRFGRSISKRSGHSDLSEEDKKK